MRPTTVYLAKLLGLFTMIVCAWLMLRPEAGMALIQALLQQPVIQTTYSFIALGLGLAMALGHNHWRGGILTVVVTIIGWVVLVRGFVLLLVPGPTILSLLQSAGFQRVYLPVLAIPMILGLYLTFAGFTSRSDPDGAK